MFRRLRPAPLALAVGLTASLVLISPWAASSSTLVWRAAASPACTILGTSGDDVLFGSARNDVICGMGGDDVIRGGGGSDLLLGGAGADQLLGGAGADQLLGGGGADTLSGQGGADLLRGGPAADRFTGGDGVDTVSYAGQSTSVNADLDGRADDGSRGEGDRIAVDIENLTGGARADRLAGATGGNTLTGGGGDDQIDGAGGADHLAGGPGEDTIQGGPGPDTLKGGDAGDTLLGGAGSDQLAGQPGDDYLDGQDGVDTLDGGSGLNTCIASPLEPAVATCRYDDSAPQLAGFSVDPRSVDTGSGPVTLTFTARLVDDLTGPAGAGYRSSPTQVRFTHPSGQSLTAVFMAEDRVSGTAIDGWYRTTATLPQGAAQGTWTVTSFLLVDQVGNLAWLTGDDLTAAGLPVTFENTGAGDSKAPELRGFSVDPLSVDTASGPVTLTFTARLVDDLTGPAGAGYRSSPTQVRFTHPSGQSLTAVFMAEDRVSGTAIDGWYRTTATLPQGAAQGTWTVTAFLLVDQVGNLTRLTGDDLTAAGLPTTFQNG